MGLNLKEIGTKTKGMIDKGTNYIQENKYELLESAGRIVVSGLASIGAMAIFGGLTGLDSTMRDVLHDTGYRKGFLDGQLDAVNLISKANSNSSNINIKQ